MYKFLILKKKIFLLLSFFIFLFFLSFFFQPKTKKLASNQFKVFVQNSQAQRFTPTLTLSGSTLLPEKITIKGEIGGKIKSIEALKGTIVKKGTVLFTLEDSDYKAQMEKAQALLIQRKAEYEAAKKLEKKELFAENKLLASEANFKNAQADLSKAAYMAEQLIIKAPIDAYYEDRLVNSGDYISASPMPTSVAVLLPLEPLKIMCEVPEMEINQLKINQKAKIFIPSLQKEFSFYVSFISKEGNPKTRCYKVELTPQNPIELRGGLTAEIRIEKEPVLAHKIPSSSLSLNEENQVGVMAVPEEGLSSFLPVSIVQAERNYFYITGLPESIALITEGGEFIKAGEKIESVKINKEKLEHD